MDQISGMITSTITGTKSISRTTTETDTDMAISSTMASQHNLATNIPLIQAMDMAKFLVTAGSTISLVNGTDTNNSRKINMTMDLDISTIGITNYRGNLPPGRTDGRSYNIPTHLVSLPLSIRKW